MSKHNKKTAGAFFAASIVLAVFFIVFRILLMIRYMDFEKEMFTGGGNLPTILNIAVAVIALLLFSSIFFFQKEGMCNPYEQPVTTMTTFGASLSGFMMLASFVMRFYYLFLHKDNVTMNLAATTNFASIQKLFAILVCFVAIPAALYFFMTASIKPKNRNTLCILSMSVILWNAFLIIATYFDMTVSFNSPVKILNQVSVIFIMLFMLNETRYIVGIEKPRLQLATSFVAIFLVAVSAIPNIILSVYNTLSVDLIYSAVQISILIYMISRVASHFQEERIHRAGQTSICL